MEIPVLVNLIVYGTFITIFLIVKWFKKPNFNWDFSNIKLHSNVVDINEFKRNREKRILS